MKREDIEKAAVEFNLSGEISADKLLADFATSRINAVIEEMVVALDEQSTWDDYDPGETAIEVIRRFIVGTATEQERKAK